MEQERVQGGTMGTELHFEVEERASMQHYINNQGIGKINKYPKYQESLQNKPFQEGS